MDEILKRTLLYDFYSELLTENQREIYRQYILEDLSLAEISQERGISRQGVHDMVKRCQKILDGYEEKLHLAERFVSIRGHVCRIRELSCAGEEVELSGTLEEIGRLSEVILKEL